MPQPGLSSFLAGGRLGRRAVIQRRRSARTRWRSSPSRPPSRPSIVASRPPATKIHASASGRGRRGRARGAARRGSRSAKKSCTSRIWRRSASAITSSSAATVSAWIQRSIEPQLRALRHVGVRDRAEAAAAGSSASAALGARLAEARPRLVEAGEVQVALRAEVPVEDRLGDPRLARDLRGRRAAIARAREDAAGGVEHRLPPLLAPAAAARSLRSSQPRRRRGLARRARAVLDLADRRARRPQRRRGRAARRPRARGGSRDEACGSRCRSRRPATIAPMIAIPSEPPTWRMLFSTAEPTPALSTADGAHRRRRHRRHRSRHPDPAEQQAGQERPEALVRAELRVVEQRARRAASCRRRRASASRPGR